MQQKFLATVPKSTGSVPCRRVLIANRGEIAQRIIRTCDSLGVESIAIYTRQEQKAAFWKAATESYYAGDLENVRNVYTDPERLISIAHETRCDSVHPGYGYLSENAEFADLVTQSGLLWIGPSAKTISILGDKAACKAFLREHAGNAVPLIPGVASTSQDPDFLHKEAEKMGYPVLLKASAGGGGKGMRIVERSEDFMNSLKLAKSEASRSFGSDLMLLEKYIASGKHIEVQMFGDNHGNCMILGDRECSVQRRHQKVIEEAPAIASAKLKTSMQKAARAIAKATNYCGAGTVEFIVDTIEQRAYFLEVNTRIQVEHPVTEEIYGIDLVSLQFFVAAGGDLTSVPVPTASGHAVELRLYAEDPYTNFLPQRGLVTMFKESKIEARYESSVQSGVEVSINFDPMIAKIIVFESSRSAALEKAEKVMRSTVCLGLKTNQRFLEDCLSLPSFRDASYCTSFIQDNAASLLKAQDKHRDERGVLITSALLRALRREPTSSFAIRSTEVITTAYGDQRDLCITKINNRASKTDEYTLELSQIPGVSYESIKGALNQESARLVHRYYTVQGDNQKRRCDIKISDVMTSINDGYTSITARVLAGTKSAHVIATVQTDFNDVQIVHIHGYGVFHRKSGLVGFGQLEKRSALNAADNLIEYTAPMPGRVIRIEARDGSEVKEGQGLLVLESMKTEVRILARAAGTANIIVKDGEVINEGALLAKVKPLAVQK